MLRLRPWSEPFKWPCPNMRRVCFWMRVSGWPNCSTRQKRTMLVVNLVAELLSCFDHPVGIEPSPSRPTQNLLVEPLSGRELEVLQCIAEGCSNQEIADRFVLSPKTVKRHISNIYAKLEAKNRTQAVSLARALKLIE